MRKLDLTVACEDYDRVAALASGQVQVDGCRVIFLPLHAEELFHRAFGNAEFDVCELSLSSYVLACSRGSCPYVAIPAFPSRAFRHSAVYVRADRGIEAPADLRGRPVGVPEYQMTAAVWVRGMLSDIYGMKPHEMRWRTGGLAQPGRTEKLALDLPRHLDVQAIPAGRTLDEMLAEGELDAVVSARPPASFGRNPMVRRLFPDYPRAEQDYFRATGIFPIMHVVGIRRDKLERHPWLAYSALKAFSQAKAACLPPLRDVGALAVMLPWLAAEYERTVALMGHDYWPYGIEPNRTTLETVLRYLHEQGLTGCRQAIDGLFAPGTMSTHKL